MFCRIALVLILMAASVVMAPLRGHMAGRMNVTICTDGGVQTVTLDAQGNPVASHAPCPDCLPGFGPAPLTDAFRSSWMAFATAMSLPLPRRIEAAGLLVIHATARGPPLSA